MIAKLIRWSIANRFLVLLATVMVSAWGVYSVLRTPLDALPDLSDVQVIIRTTYPGQAPRIVENQVTYPLATRVSRCGAPPSATADAAPRHAALRPRAGRRTDHRTSAWREISPRARELDLRYGCRTH